MFEDLRKLYELVRHKYAESVVADKLDESREMHVLHVLNLAHVLLQLADPESGVTVDDALESDAENITAILLNVLEELDE